MRHIDGDRLKQVFHKNIAGGEAYDDLIDMQPPITEVYTKDDMVAMLEDLKQDFIAEAYGIEMDCTDYVVNVADIDKVIQLKINALRGEKDETDKSNK